MNKSEFMKWRCLVALAHLDGVVTNNEKNFLQYNFSRHPFTNEELDILRHDMANAKSFKDFFEQIYEDRDRQNLVHLAFTLFWSDSDFHACERRVYEYLQRMT